MEIKTSDFITSAVNQSQYPESSWPEVGFIGRSNVGKSSIINSLTQRKALARVSNTPGRTRLVNFFLINGCLTLVDLPGYGYAKVSKADRAQFGKIIEEYLSHRSNLKKMVLLVDARHKPTEDDCLMLNYFRHYGIPFQIVATKLDKLKRNEIKKNERIIRETLALSMDEEVLMYSSLSKENRQKVLDAIFLDLLEPSTETIR
ncbi:GTP-binding protein EngB [Clostridiaceae bacterium JG1575]|nr:GTP-binding protein EngB [Clostridiaceae bacterium JG1575]